MTHVITSISEFLSRFTSTHNGPDLLARWNGDIETQVNVDISDAQMTDKKGIWTDGVDRFWHIRIPRDADSNPWFNNYELPWSLENHAEAIGATGWDWKARRSRWVGFDFDALVGHKAGLTTAELESIKEATISVPWVEVRKSTSGNGLHLYVLFDADGIPTANHTEHANLAKAILPILSQAAGYDLDARIDVCGYVLWIWHRKMTRENGGLSLIKAAEAPFPTKALPNDWRAEKSQSRKKSPAVSSTQASGGGSPLSRALEAMRALPNNDNADGSKRLFMAACRGVEHNLSDSEVLRAIREYEQEQPFPREWSDSEITQRIRQAEKKAERGTALKPSLDVSGGELAKLSRSAWDFIRAANQPPVLFRYGGVPVRIERDDRDEPSPKSVYADQLRHHLANWINFTVFVGKTGARKKCLPPMYLVKDLLATPDMPLPILDRITEVPVFASDGSLELSPGYSPGSRALYVPSSGFVVPQVSTEPSDAEIRSACELICNELLGDFPFVSDAEKAHAVALFLLPFARGIIEGPTPLHLFEKPSPGTGATLLVNALSYPAVGHPVATMTEGRDEDEWRKRITAKLRTSPAYVVIDNLRAPLDSAAVASAITSPTWEDRLLGASQILKLPVRCAWVATGNNPKLSFEIARRTVRIRLNAKTDKPWLGRSFRHPDLMSWAAQNRANLVAAALTLIQAWIATGRPSATNSLGMFEGWSRTMGGILEVSGIRGFLSNCNELYAAADEEGAEVRGFLEAWWSEHKVQAVGTKELLPTAREPLASYLGNGGEHSQMVRLGKKLSDLKERTYQIEVSGEPTKLVSVASVGRRAGSNLWSLAIAA